MLLEERYLESVRESFGVSLMATLIAINPLWSLVTYKSPHSIISKSPVYHPPRAVIRQHT